MTPTMIVPGSGWGTSLWELEDARRRTLAALDNLDPEAIDIVPAGFHNSVGTLLHHIALIEAAWLYADILLVDYPQWVLETFPDGDRDEEGHLVPSRKPLTAHLATLALVREELLATLRNQADEEFTRVRRSDSGELTPQWVLHHLRQHEAEHRGQIQALMTALRGLPGLKLSGERG